MADALRSSPIIHGEDGYTPAANFGSGFDDVDPNLDPELALVSWFTNDFSSIPSPETNLYFFMESYRADLIRKSEEKLCF